MNLRLSVLALLALLSPLAKGEVVLFEGGEVKAVVVLSDEATPGSRFAARELAEHFEAATGQALPVLAESEAGDFSGARLFVGSSQMAKEAGFKEVELEGEEYRIAATRRDLLFEGAARPEDEGKPGEVPPRQGALWPVYHFLEEEWGVCWIWPGELGRYVPRSERLASRAMRDDRARPRLAFRSWSHQPLAPSKANEAKWGGAMARDLPGMGLGREATQAYHRDLTLYLRRHRVRPSTLRMTHTLQPLWAKEGKNHPEWFMLNADGQRGPRVDPNSSVSEAAYWRQPALCVSNSELPRYLASEAFWNGGEHLFLGEVDYRVFCLCEDCRRLDPPQTPAPAWNTLDYQPMTTHRYLHLWQKVREHAKARNPEVKVGSFLYMNYLPAPVGEVDLKGFYGAFTPWTLQARYYPMPPEVDQWIREQWSGWQKTGMELIYRPNFFHAGHVMPHLSTWQAGEFFRFAAQNGMEAAHMDRLPASWGTKSLMTYLFMELMWNPEREIADIRQRYFSAFGPAAKQVEAYFDYWETYSTAITRAPDAVETDLFIPQTFLSVRYPPEVFPPAFELLERAHQEAQTSPHEEFAQRVAFLRAGLEHARLSAQLYQRLERDGRTIPSDPERREAFREALNELIAFRTQNRHLPVCDYNQAISNGDQRIRYQELLPYLRGEE